MGVGYIVVEGHGEVEAVRNLLHRLWGSLELSYIAWADPIRQPKLHLEPGVAKSCERLRRAGDVDAVLIVRDEDDRCPRDTAPETAKWVQELQLPFPVAVVLLYREYETLFLSSIQTLAGEELVNPPGTMPRPGLRSGAIFRGNPEGVRGAKEWLSKQFPLGRRYKPTLDQLPLTRLISFDLLRESGLPCFRTLERGLRFLAKNRGAGGVVYPPPKE